MRFLIYLAKALGAVAFFSLAASNAGAADWTVDDAAASGTNSCHALRPGGVCWLMDIAADSTAIIIGECKKVIITVYGTAADIMPQDCKDFACAADADREDMLATALTGDSPNTGVVLLAPPEILRIDWTAGGAAPTIKIKCGS